MPRPDGKKRLPAGISADESDLSALIAQLEDEVRRAGPRHLAGARASSVRVNARAAADRPLGGRTGAVGALQKPVKVLVRKLTRWYVEPVFADQRGFNDALLKLVDDLYDQIDRLEAELREAQTRAAADDPR